MSRPSASNTALRPAAQPSPAAVRVLRISVALIAIAWVPLAFAQQHALPDLQAKPGTAPPNRFYMYGVVARMALLAASLELEKTDPNPEVY